SNPAPDQSKTFTELFDLGSVYRRLGRLVSGPPLPFVGSVAFVAGPGDSTLAVLALSLENRSLVFQPERKDFVARYRVDITAQPDSGPGIQIGKEEVVRVGNFQETLRNDESILFQQNLRLMPGHYRFTVTLRDRGSPALGRAEADYTVPALHDGNISPAFLAYQVTGRARRGDDLAVIINPRATVAYGGDTALAYVEGYRMGGPRALPFELWDEQDSVVLRDTLHFLGDREVESEVIRLTPDSAPLGELKLVVGSGDQQRTTSILVSFSQAWVVTNYEDMLNLLRYFGEDTRLDQLRKVPASDRPRLWREFWIATDPNKLTPENEALNEYFGRLGTANARFNGEGIAGWKTDRGEVYITLGDPDEIFDASPTSQGRTVRWSYTSLRLTVFFQDETGFGRFRLTPASRSEYEQVLGRVRRRIQ
ncbi:MAG: GWxTD domain-containing protein, partial [Gemmatimonadales bacterium]